MYKGQLKSWNDSKGFGFIESPDLNQDTFIHISTLKAMSRKPKQGDFIYFETENQANGKIRAVNCRIEGVAAKSITKRNVPRMHKKSSAPTSKIVTTLAIVLIAVFAYQRLNISPDSKPIQHMQTKPNITLSDKTISSSRSTQFTCDGRQHCSQMTSRAEAEFFTLQCPNTKMDGDRDGIPCENDSRF